MWDFQDIESQKLLQTIINKQGIDLTDTDLVSIFQTYCPAGTTQELCSYAPCVFDYLSKNLHCSQNTDVIAVWDNFLEWIFYHKGELETLCKYEQYTLKIWSYIQNILAVKYNMPQDINNLILVKELLHVYFCSPLIKDTRRNFLLEYIKKTDQFAIVILHTYCESRTKGEPLYAFKKLIDYHFTQAYMRDIIELCLEQILTSGKENEWMLNILENAEIWIQLDPVPFSVTD